MKNSRRVVEATFHRQIAAIGGSTWLENVGSGGYSKAEYDVEDRMLVLHPGKAGLKTRRIPVSNVAELVYGATQAKPE